MVRPLLLPGLAALTLALTLPAAAKSDPAPTVADDDARSMPDKIREKLSSDGYRDITIVPTSYVVSATDKDGKRVLLLIGPASSTTLPEEAPSTAQSPPDKREPVQQ
jgi:hypothetical protein